MSARCEKAALRVGKICHRLFRYAAQATHMMTKTDWHHHCLAAVCLSYAELGGTSENADSFDWDSSEFIWAASRRLQQDVVGKTSDFADIHRRHRIRSNGAATEELRWDSWRSPAGGLADTSFRFSQQTHQQALTGEYFSDHNDLDIADREHVFAQLLQELESVLQPREYRWLVERYVEGRDQYQMADALVAEKAEYQRDGGRARAVNLINVTVHRAKAKAQRVLNPRFRALAAEVA